MFFPISGAHISPIYLVTVGFLIGILGGFFGVGGSFIAGPALRLAGLDWNFAVGTDLAHIVGKSVVAVRRHRAMGNVDLRLGLIMAVGTIGGAEVGAQAIQMLEARGEYQFCRKHCLHRRLCKHFDFHDLGKPKNLVVIKRTIAARRCKRSEIKKRSFGVRPRHARDSTPQNLAHDFPPGVWNKGYFTLDNSFGGFRRWSIQRLSRRRRRLHSHAVHGLRAGSSRRISQWALIFSKSSSPPATAHLATRLKVTWTF